MNPSQKPFRINVGFLINQPVGYSRVLPFKLDKIDIEDESLRNFNGSINLTRTQDGLIAQVVIDAEVESECSRCLEPFKNKIFSKFKEFFTFPYVEASEDEIRVPEDGNIDFEPILHDYILMEMPIKPVCKFDCMGLCDICGQNLNQSICEHYQNHKFEDNTIGTDQKELQEEDSTTETFIT